MTDSTLMDIPERRTVVITESEAAAHVKSGMTVAIGGFINAGHPMGIIRELLRRDVGDLTVVGAASSGLEIDMLIAAGRVRRLVSPYVGAEGLASIGPAFRVSAQQGALEMWELDEAHFYAGLRAAAQRLPFNPWRAGIGTSYPQLNPRLKEFRDPINNELLIAVPAINIDVALLHASHSDAYGNVQHEGTGYGDRAIYAAADTTIVQVEKLVSNQSIRSNPLATSIPGADAVVRLPYGAHPFGSHGYYPPDASHISTYVAAAMKWLKSGSREELDDYLETFIFGPESHGEYLERIGMEKLLSLTEFDG